MVEDVKGDPLGQVESELNELADNIGKVAGTVKKVLNVMDKLGKDVRGCKHHGEEVLSDVPHGGFIVSVVMAIYIIIAVGLFFWWSRRLVKTMMENFSAGVNRLKAELRQKRVKESRSLPDISAPLGNEPVKRSARGVSVANLSSAAATVRVQSEVPGDVPDSTGGAAADPTAIRPAPLDNWEDSFLDSGGKFITGLSNQNYRPSRSHVSLGESAADAGDTIGEPGNKPPVPPKPSLVATRADVHVGADFRRSWTNFYQPIGPTPDRPVQPGPPPLSVRAQRRPPVGDLRATNLRNRYTEFSSDEDVRTCSLPVSPRLEKPLAPSMVLKPLTPNMVLRSGREIASEAETGRQR